MIACDLRDEAVKHFHVHLSCFEKLSLLTLKFLEVSLLVSEKCALDVAEFFLLKGAQVGQLHLDDVLLLDVVFEGLNLPAQCFQTLYCD